MTDRRTRRGTRVEVYMFLEEWKGVKRRRVKGEGKDSGGLGSILQARVLTFPNLELLVQWTGPIWSSLLYQAFSMCKMQWFNHGMGAGQSL